ncbi:MAG: chorismate mutase [Ruminococcus sp.]|nr:chorismate mutase [Ruminococcus sp.]
MDLQELREQINQTDRQIEELFARRMALCLDVAQYKIENNMEVFQAGREKEIIERVRNNAPKGLENSAEVLFTTLMDISKSKQYQRFFAANRHIEHKTLDLSASAEVAVPGTAGSYSEEAARKLLPNGSPRFFADFEDVIKSVLSGECELGILPIQNSTAGSVSRTYELMKKYELNICATTKVKIDHCLAAGRAKSIEEVTQVFSHEQALQQCSEFLKAHGLKGTEYFNTALAADKVKGSDEPIAAVCSRKCAKEKGLTILAENIANANDNFTRFILISKDTLCPEGADIISVSLTLPHQRSALYRMLTKFSVAGLNLTMIESKPIANTDFDAVFYLDFEGSILSHDVVRLLAELESELSYFRFLGNYKEF